LDVNKKVRELLGVKPLSFADEETTMDLTGMMIGAVTAFGTGDQPSSVDMRTEQAQVVMVAAIAPASCCSTPTSSPSPSPSGGIGP